MDITTELKIIPYRDYEIDYTNYREERALRRICVKGLFYGSTKYHIEPQFILWAYDYGKKDDRSFAIKDVHSIKEA